MADIVVELPDGRLAIPYQTVMDWPQGMRDWIRASNYWRPSEDPCVQAFTAPQHGQDND